MKCSRALLRKPRGRVTVHTVFLSAAEGEELRGELGANLTAAGLATGLPW